MAFPLCFISESHLPRTILVFISYFRVVGAGIRGRGFVLKIQPIKYGVHVAIILENNLLREDFEKRTARSSLLDILSSRMPLTPEKVTF
jgi:hypothetical protein